MQPHGMPLHIRTFSILTVLLAFSLGIALADPPGTEFLAETVEVKFTPPIVELATALEHDPLKIFNYVRTNVEFKPYYGSVKAAQETLWEKQGNDFDQASLLIALLRVSGIPARYVYGEVEIPIESAKNWIGVQDPNVVGDMFASGGIPSSLGLLNGVITKLKTDHVWVEAWLSYDQYEGASQSTASQRWIPLDPSFTQYTLESKEGADLTAVWNQIGWNPQSYTIPEVATPPYGSVVDSNQLSADRTQVSDNTTNWIVNLPDETPLPSASFQEFVPNTREYRTLAASTPYAVKSVAARFSQIPANYHHMFVLDIEGAQYAASLPEIAAKQLTLSYVAATPSDQAILDAYGSLSDVPANNVQMISELKLAGQTVLSGPPGALGTKQTLTIKFIPPGSAFGPEQAVNEIVVGSYQGIGLDVGVVPDELLKERIDAFDDLSADPSSLVDRDQVIGEILWTTAMYYQRATAAHCAVTEASKKVAVTRFPSLCLVALELEVTKTNEIPSSVSMGGFSIDVDISSRSVFERQGPTNPPGSVTRNVFQYNIARSAIESLYEHQVFEELLGCAQTMSCIKAFSALNDQGVPTYTVSAETLNDVLPMLSHPSSVIDDIQRFISQGYVVFVPGQPLAFGSRSFSPYFVAHRGTGAGGGMLNQQAGGGGWDSYVHEPQMQAYIELLLQMGSDVAQDTAVEKGIELLGVYFPPVEFAKGVVDKAFGIAEVIHRASLSWHEYVSPTLTETRALYNSGIITHEQRVAMSSFAVAAAVSETLWGLFVELAPGTLSEIGQEAGGKLARSFVSFSLNILNRTATINRWIQRI